MISAILKSRWLWLGVILMRIDLLVVVEELLMALCAEVLEDVETQASRGLDHSLQLQPVVLELDPIAVLHASRKCYLRSEHYYNPNNN